MDEEDKIFRDYIKNRITLNEYFKKIVELKNEKFFTNTNRPNSDTNLRMPGSTAKTGYNPANSEGVIIPECTEN